MDFIHPIYPYSLPLKIFTQKTSPCHFGILVELESPSRT